MRTQGYACIVDPDVGTRETDTHTCAHCQRLVHAPVNKKLEEVGDFCRSCMKVICLNCAGNGCTPFLKRIERMGAKAAAVRGYF